MITIYFVEEDGTVIPKPIKESELQSYINLGWTTEKPVDFAGAVDETDSREEVDFSDGTDTTPYPFGYGPLVRAADGTLVDSSVYVYGINPNGNWYYPGDEIGVLANMSPQEIRTLQDRLVRVPRWLSTENYSIEYGRNGPATRNALIKAMTASNFIAGAGYETAIDIELLNPFQEIYVPKTYRESDKASRLQIVDAIFDSIGRTPTKKERNYYEVLLKDLEQKEFYNDEAIARMEVEGPEVTVTETRRAGVEPLTERPMEIVEEEITVEPIPEEVDSVARLQETIKGDFEGVLARQQDVARARNNAGSIAQSIMRLKALGG